MTPAEFLRNYESSGRNGVEHTLKLIDDNAVYWFSDGTAHVGKSRRVRSCANHSWFNRDSWVVIHKHLNKGQRAVKDDSPLSR